MVRKTFQRFAVTQLQVATHYAFHEEFAGKVEPLAATYAPLAELSGRYHAALAVEKRVVVRPSAMRYTYFLREADRRRDRFLGVICRVVDAQRYSPLEACSQAASRLRAGLAPFRGLARRPYGESSAGYRKLIALLQEEEWAADVATLRLELEVEALGEAQQAFEAMYSGPAVQESQERAELHAIKTPETRRRVDAVYQEIVRYIGALAIALPSAEIEAVVDWHNGAAWKLRQVIANQGKTWTRKEKSLPVIRPLQTAETPLLRDFLYEAIYVPEGVEPPPRSVVDLPELQVYIQDFGSRPGDNALVAESRGQVVGAVWTRLMNDYGHVDDQTPSLAISLYPQYRGRGIGTQLMRAMLDRLHREGYAQVSLSVQKVNPAVRLYERLGFKTVRETDEEYVMVCLTSPP